MPFIQINQLAGMDAETRSRVIAEVTRAYAEASGKDGGRVWVHINDMAPHSFGVGGETKA